MTQSTLFELTPPPTVPPVAEIEVRRKARAAAMEKADATKKMKGFNGTIKTSRQSVISTLPALTTQPISEVKMAKASLPDSFSIDNLEFAPIPAHRVFQDLTGQKFGRLFVLGFKGRERAHSWWWCRCDCGTICIRSTNQLHGTAKSCGCRFVEFVRNKYGAPHRMTRTPEYYVWRNMLNRCYWEPSEKYPDYGGRGITVCDRWRRSFLDFLADMGPRPTLIHQIDRRDNDGNYEPGNCRWVTPKEQANNRRLRKNTRYLTYKGETLPAGVWAARIGIRPRTLRNRIYAGWSDERVIEEPRRGAGHSTN